MAKKMLSWIKVKSNVRSKYNEEELLKLGLSLKKHQLQAVVCLADGTLIIGHRRYYAALKVEMTELDVEIVEDEPTDSQIKQMQLIENMQREDLTGFELWMACAEWLCMNPQAQLKDLAEVLNLDPSSVTRIMAASKCSEAWQNALRDGKVGISDCYAASKLHVKQQDGLLALKLSGASRDTLEDAGKKQRTGEKPTVKTTRVRCDLSNGQCVAVSGIAMSLHEVIEALTEATKEARKARDGGLDVKTFQAVMRDRARAG